MAGEDRAEDAGAEDVHDRYGVSRLFAIVNLADPGGEGQDTVTGHGKNESRGSDDRDASTLGVVTTASIAGQWSYEI